MADAEKIESVKKLSEVSPKGENPAEEIERAAPNKEHFDSLMQSATKVGGAETNAAKPFAIERTEIHETQPALQDESVTAQQSGSATDQENRRGRQGKEGVEGIEETGSARSSRSVSTGASSSLSNEVSKIGARVGDLSRQGPDAIKTQAKEMIAQLESAKKQLSQPNASIPASYNTVLKNRLSHIDDNLKIALNKAGVEYTAPTAALEPTEGKNPVKKFIHMLTNSQHQLDQVTLSVSDLAKMEKVSPAQMLAIQVKMNFISQQVELFTNLLNKALESTKTIMNVQV